jgi:VIT1/CCC1 family predicted Fe2+/Mn2+ transporter
MKESAHRGISGNALRASVLGANDGLVSIFNLVMGVAGAQLPAREILISGIAGVLAGAISMALGEWISVQSSRELAKRELAVEARELEEQPAFELEELVGFYTAKGLPEADARELATRLMRHKRVALDVMAREELGIDPQDLGGSAWVAAGSSFALFVLGSLPPVLPFALLAGHAAVMASVAASGLGLVVLGAAIGWLNGLSLAWAAGRQLLFGMLAAGATYGLGVLAGRALGG